MSDVKAIKLSAFFIFFFSFLGLLVPLFLHNHLISYGQVNMFPDGKMGNYKFQCDLNNNFCSSKSLNIKPSKLSNCDGNQFHISFFRDKELSVPFDIPAQENIDALINLKSKFVFYKDIKPSGKIDKNKCLKYSNIYFFYKIFPNLENLYLKLKSSTVFGTSQEISPFIKGETSISNIVKRFPFNYIFKPLLWLSSFLMLIYWTKYLIFFKKNGLYKNNSFFYFGCTSAFFLFLHVLFLGKNLNIDWFDDMRRVVIVLFILCELVAEFLLARKIYLNKDFLYSKMKKSIIFFKIIFVYIIVAVTIVCLTYMTLYDASSEFNNILEWNYFIFLIFFYYLSSVIWKKIE